MNNGPEVETADALKTDRRRPGRLTDVSPELIPLLRGQAPVVPNQDFNFADPDQLRGARGLAVGVAISSVLWAALGYAAYCIF